MQVDELYALTLWIKSNIADQGVPKRYSALQQKLQQNAQANQQRVSFEDEKNVLLELVRNIPLEQLTDLQFQTLLEIGIAPYVGPGGVNYVEDTLFKNAIDVATAAERMQSALNSINAGIEWSTQTSKQLKRLADSNLIDEIGPGEILIRVKFSEAAKISNMDELKEWSRIWWEIVRGITLLHGKSPEAVRIISASKGSILLDLLAYAAFANVLLITINGSLKATERIQTIRLKEQEIKSLKLQNKATEIALGEALEEERRQRIEAITSEVLKSIKAPSAPDGEAQNALTKSIKQLVSFLEKGGHVDFIAPNPSEDESADEDGQSANSEIAEIRNLAEQVRQLENDIKLIETNLNGHSPDESQEQPPSS